MFNRQSRGVEICRFEIILLVSGRYVFQNVYVIETQKFQITVMVAKTSKFKLTVKFSNKTFHVNNFQIELYYTATGDTFSLFT